MQYEPLLLASKTPEDDAVVLRHNHLIEARYQVSPQEQRLFLWAIEQVQVRDGRSQIVRINIGELARYIGLRSGDVYQEMKAVTRRIISRRIELKNLVTGEFVQTNLVSGARYRTGSGEVEIEISQMLLPYILEVKNNYALTHMRYEMSLSSGYAMRIYAILKARQYRSNIVRVGLIELQTMLGVEDKYSRFNNFRERVLTTACSEISSTTDIIVTFNAEADKSDKRKVGSIIFRVQEKENVEALVGDRNRGSARVDEELKQRLMRVGFKSIEAEALLDQYAITDRMRLTWHLDEVERRTRDGSVKSPKAWLRSGLREDYRPERTPLEVEIATQRRAKYAGASRAVKENEAAAVVITSRKAAIERAVATLSRGDHDACVAVVSRNLSPVIKRSWDKSKDLTSSIYAVEVMAALKEVAGVDVATRMV